jgi:parvulin-like peptidyl-prolyl isomerase
MKSVTRIVLAGLVAMFAAAGLSAQTPQPAPKSQPAQAPQPTQPSPPAQTPGVIIQRVLVKVNGEIYTQKQLEQAQIDALRQQGKDRPTTKDLEGITPDILVNAVNEMLIVQRGRELGYHLTDEQFKNSITRLKTDQKLNDEQFKQALKEDNLTLDALRDQFERGYIIQTVQQREIMGHVNLTEEEAHQYYDKHPDEFMKPAAVTLREMLVAVPTDTKNAQQPFSPDADASAREKVATLRDRALKGEDFVKLVAEASDAPSKSVQGLIGPINVTDMSAGIRDAVERLKVGDITPTFRTARGYQFFKLESRTAEERLPFDNVRDQIAQKVGDARLDVEMAKYINELRSQALIEWKRDDLRQMYEKRVAEQSK